MGSPGEFRSRSPRDNTVDSVPLVTVIVPCRDEGTWIDACLESIADNDYPKDRMEVLVVDGMSRDETRSMIATFAVRHPWTRLLDNPKKTAPAALNIGIAGAKGSIIIRMDAHVEYPADYISSLVRLLEESGADNVGGVCLTQPASQTAMARAIALGMSHPLGVGNSYFRIGSAEPRWVDTVPFGCYRREVFDQIGVFDEELVRNQDDELNLRLIKHGGRILLSPKVVSRYYARNSLRKLWRMYYQYGYFKPLVVRKVKAVMTVRQLAPPAFVAGLLMCSAMAPWNFVAADALAAIVSCYSLAIGLGAAMAVRKHGTCCAMRLFLVLPTMHFSYGLGYLNGILNFWIRRKGRVGDAVDIPLSR